MSNSLRIRKADEADAETIAAVINHAFTEVEQFFVEGDRITIDEVLSNLRAGAFLVAENDEAMLGCVYVEPRGERSYLGLLSVNPRQQHRGTGLRLMSAAEEYCRTAGARFMDIKIVNLRTELPDFYRKRGYVETGSSPFPPEIDTKLPCYFIDMSKPLA